MAGTYAPRVDLWARQGSVPAIEEAMGSTRPTASSK
jgi:hypothetical protein